jgi:hypothetical protein
MMKKWHERFIAQFISNNTNININQSFSNALEAKIFKSKFSRFDIFRHSYALRLILFKPQKIYPKLFLSLRIKILP